MKILAFLIVIAALFASCSKHNDAATKPAVTPATLTAADIKGTWLIAADTSFETQNGQTTPTPGSPKTVIVYDDNGIGHYTQPSGQTTTSFTYTVSGGVIKMIESYDSNSTGEDDFTVISVSSDKLIIRETEGTSTYIDAELLKQ